MILSLLYIGLIIVLEARPVYLHFASRFYQNIEILWESLIFYGIALALSALIAILPILLGIKALKNIEL